MIDTLLILSAVLTSLPFIYFYISRRNSQQSVGQLETQEIKIPIEVNGKN